MWEQNALKFEKLPLAISIKDNLFFYSVF